MSEAIWSSSDGEFSTPDLACGEGDGTELGFSEKYVSVLLAFSRRASETAASELAFAVGLEDCLRMLFPGTLFRVGLFGGDLMAGETMCAVGAAAAIAGEDVEEDEEVATAAALLVAELVVGTPPTRELGTMVLLLVFEVVLFEDGVEDSYSVSSPTSGPEKKSKPTPRSSSSSSH